MDINMYIHIHMQVSLIALLGGMQMKILSRTNIKTTPFLPHNYIHFHCYYAPSHFKLIFSSNYY